MLSLAKKRATFGNFQRNYLYMITASRIPPKLSQLVSGTVGDGINIDIYNDSIFFPDHKTDEITVQVSGEKFLIPGIDASTKVSEFTFYDDENQNIYNFFKGCKEQTGTQKNNANLGGDGPSGKERDTFPDEHKACSLQQIHFLPASSLRPGAFAPSTHTTQGP